MMNTADFEISNSDRDTVIHVKKQLDEIYANYAVFGLSLETLELSRRFNNVFSSTDELDKMDPVEFNRLMALTSHLERNLTRELR